MQKVEQSFLVLHNYVVVHIMTEFGTMIVKLPIYHNIQIYIMVLLKSTWHEKLYLGSVGW